MENLSQNNELTGSFEQKKLEILREDVKNFETQLENTRIRFLLLKTHVDNFLTDLELNHPGVVNEYRTVVNAIRNT